MFKMTTLRSTNKKHLLNNSIKLCLRDHKLSRCSLRTSRIDPTVLGERYGLSIT